MLNKLTSGLVIAAFVSGASAQTFPNIQAGQPYSAYVQDARGIIARSSYGLCWRTGFWTAADAVEGCDGVLAPPIANPIAPAFVAKPDTSPIVSPALPATSPQTVESATTPAPLEKPAPLTEKVNLASDALFDSGKSALKPAGKAKLGELASRLRHLRVESIIATGHTDSVGSSSANFKLSIQRAEAVKAYLISKGVGHSLIRTAGKGEKQPVATNKTAAGRAQNRRVEIEITGSRTK